MKFYTVHVVLKGNNGVKDSTTFLFHAGGSLSEARGCMKQALKSYEHWPNVKVTLRRWVRPGYSGTHTWMAEKK